MRDLLVIRIDPSRLDDPEIASEGEADRLKTLAARYSREDLLRAFDLLARAEGEIRYSSQPRHHFEMALVKWIQLRKLVPLEDLIASMQSGGTVPLTPARPAAQVRRTSRGTAATAGTASRTSRRSLDAVSGTPTARPAGPAEPRSRTPEPRNPKEPRNPRF